MFVAKPSSLRGRVMLPSPATSITGETFGNMGSPRATSCRHLLNRPTSSLPVLRTWKIALAFPVTHLSQHARLLLRPIQIQKKSPPHFVSRSVLHTINFRVRFGTERNY